MGNVTEISWESISEEDKKKLGDVYQNIEKIWEFSCKANESLMIYLFGEQLGKHYWEKLSTTHDRNIITFLRGMDIEKKSDLFANIFLNETLYAHC